MTRMAHRPKVFKGISKNIMTPNVMSYWRIKHNGTTRYIELAEGTGLSNQPIYGVTVRPDLDFDHKLSKLFHSEHAAWNYIAGLESVTPVTDTTEDN